MTDRHPSLQTRDFVKAIQILEGSFPSSEEEQLDAWQLLIDSGIAWQLQGTYARHAERLIEAGLVEATVKA